MPPNTDNTAPVRLGQCSGLNTVKMDATATADRMAIDDECTERTLIRTLADGFSVEQLDPRAAGLRL